MSQIAIKTENIGKEYRIGKRREQYSTLRDSIMSQLHGMSSRFRRKTEEENNLRRSENQFWALSNISIEIKRGEIVGLIGRNGAGKSTLLKVLSRITDPSTGWADIHGRVGSLLEVGTGFHPELSGRENIYLNGAILGMGRREIDQKLDQIVDFSEVDKFIDTPVKHYSSGMYLRLAFAVAAHMEPEILLVDEVLAVGDVAFQKKCLGRMGDIAQDGRTVLFVSHNMSAIRAFCERGIVLKDGQVIKDGDVSQSIEHYYREIGALADPNASESSGNLQAGFSHIRINRGLQSSVAQGLPCEITATLRHPNESLGFKIFAILEDMHSRTLFHLTQDSTGLGLSKLAAGTIQIKLNLPGMWLSPGLYSFYFKAIVHCGSNPSRYVSDRIPFDISGISSAVETVLVPEAKWNVSPLNSSESPSETRT